MQHGGFQYREAGRAGFDRGLDTGRELIGRSHLTNFETLAAGLSGGPQLRSATVVIRDFALVWAEEGLDAVRKVAKKSPEAFVAIRGGQWRQPDRRRPPPFGEAAVGGEDHGALLVAGIDGLEEQIAATGNTRCVSSPLGTLSQHRSC